MEERLKQRLVGAAVLVSLAVVFVPILLDVPEEFREDPTPITEIPDRPSSRIEPSVVTTLELPETPRLDAEVERERNRQASGTPTEDHGPGAEVPVRISIPAPAEESEDVRVALPTSSEAPAPTSVRPERSEPPGAGSSVPAAQPPDDASGQQRVTVAPATVTEGWIVQLGSFRKAENARALRKRLMANGYPAFVESGTSAGSEVSRVFVGPMLDRGRARDSAAKLRRDMQIEGIVVPYPGG